MNRVNEIEYARFLIVLWVGLQCVSMVFPDDTRMFFLYVTHFHIDNLSY